jgi:hypothetical protein
MPATALDPSNIFLEENLNLGPNVKRMNTEESVNSPRTQPKTRSFRVPSALRRATASFFRAPSPTDTFDPLVQESPLFEAFEHRNLPLIKKLAANLGYKNKVTLAVRNAAENAHETLVTDMIANAYVGKSTKQIQNEEKLLHNIVIALGGTTESSGGKRKTRRKRRTYRKRKPALNMEASQIKKRSEMPTSLQK